MARARKSKKNKLKVNFEGVEGRTLVPEGDYHAKVLEVTQEEGSDSGEPYLAWKLETIDDNKKLNGKNLYYNTSLQPKALWNLRNLLETLGVEIPDDELEIDLDELVDLELMVTVEHEKYEGKNKARIVDFAPVGDSDDDEEGVEVEDDEDKGEEDGEEVEAVSASDVKEMSTKELKELINEYELECEFNGAKTLRKKRSLVISALEEAELLAEE